MTDQQSLPPAKLKAIESLFADIPKDYPAAEAHLKQLSSAFREALARTLAPRLSEHLQQETPSTLKEYQRDAKYVDELTTELGLNVTIDDKPALLIGELAYRHLPDVARFALVVPHGRTEQRHADETGQMPQLQLEALAPANAAKLRRLRETIEKSQGPRR